MVVRRRQSLSVFETAIERRFGLLGESLDFSTNDERLLNLAVHAFGRFEVPDGRSPLRLRVLADLAPEDGDHGLVRHRADGSHYVVTAPGAAASVNLADGSAVAFVGLPTLANERLVRYAFLEGPALSLAARGRGYFALHAAGIARDGVGVALQGGEGAGKSTLAFACARRGLDVFAEDAVFVRLAEPGLEFWGLPWIQRLLPTAAELFPELSGLEPTAQPNGELKLEVDLDTWLPGRATARAIPGAVVLVERAADGGASMSPLPRGDAEQAVEALWPWPAEWQPAHARAAQALGELPVYRLINGGSVETAVDLIEELLDRLASRRPAA